MIMKHWFIFVCGVLSWEEFIWSTMNCSVLRCLPFIYCASLLRIGSSLRFYDDFFHCGWVGYGESFGYLDCYHYYWKHCQFWLIAMVGARVFLRTLFLLCGSTFSKFLHTYLHFQNGANCPYRKIYFSSFAYLFLSLQKVID